MRRTRLTSKYCSIVILLLVMVSFTLPSSYATSSGTISQGNLSIEYRNVTVYAPAVAQTAEGYLGVISSITVTIQNNGAGRVFVDTLPLTQIDMQGSARLAVKVASALVRNDNRTDINPAEYDYFFVVRTIAPIIGGPSAGGIMTVAVVALLENWPLDNQTVMTGMINPDGSIGPVGGIIQKIDAAFSVGATRFLFPEGQGTYMETITETTSRNGWTQIITKQIPRNVSDYALDTYDMEAIEVEDINDALLHFTGWSFPIVASNDSITTEDYIDSMKPLATNLLEEARSSFVNASDCINSTDISNQYPSYYRNQVTDILNNAEEKLLESESWYDQNLYYTSTSKSFQSLIDSQFVSYACEYFNTSDKEGFIQSLLDEAIALNNNRSELAKNAEINGMISLQCVGAAQKRASDADTFITDAETRLNNNDDLSALYNIAYAMQRSESVEWWIGISAPFNDTGDINASEIDQIAAEYIQDAQQAVIYSTVIVQEIGESSSYLNEAEDLLETAQDDREKGYTAAAVFEALESLVKANLALELVDDDVEEKIDRARERASASISISRNRGIEPVLAVSYYEFAQSLVNESALDSAIVYYKYSDIIAGSLGFTSMSGSQSSRFVGIPESEISFWSRGIFRYIDYFAFFVIVGVMGGLGLGILVGLASQTRRHKKKSVQQTLEQKSIDDYYQRQKTEYFAKDEIPRSIQDYYKKMK